MSVCTGTRVPANTGVPLNRSGDVVISGSRTAMLDSSLPAQWRHLRILPNSDRPCELAEFFSLIGYGRRRNPPICYRPPHLGPELLVLCQVLFQGERCSEERMKTRFRVSAVATTAIFLALGVGSQVSSQPNPPSPNTVQKGSAMPTRASGTFEVKLSPQALHHQTEDKALARLAIDKQFHGDLEATSQGEMLSAGTAVQGSAEYVAIERVTGKLNGRSGTFVLQHSGTMTRGTPQLSITVVPDSGTGELVGLTGTMTIDIADGKHSYTFEYTLAAPGT